MTTSTEELSRVCLTLPPDWGPLDWYWEEAGKPSQLINRNVNDGDNCSRYHLRNKCYVPGVWALYASPCLIFTAILRIKNLINTHLKMKKLRLMKVEEHVEGHMVMRWELESRCLISGLPGVAPVLAGKVSRPRTHISPGSVGSPAESPAVLG